MFCTKCGKELYDGDRFCANCGAEVREARRSKYDDVVFNPPFKVEAQRRTEEILRNTESREAEIKRETVSFDWNLEGFPSASPRKTEAVDFNWDSVLEKKKESRQVNVEKIKPENELFFSAPRDKEGDTKEVPSIKSILLSHPKEEAAPEEIPEVTQLKEELAEEPAITIEDLERELFGADAEPEIQEAAAVISEPTIVAGALFGGAGESEIQVPDAPEYTKPDEKFYTYNQKFDAFQELLEKEKERLQALEDSYKKDKESMDYTWVGEVFPQQTAEPVPEAAEPLKVVDIVAPSLTMAVEIIRDQIGEQAGTENAAEEIKEPEVPETPETPEVPDVPETPEVPAESEEQEQKEEVPQNEAAPSAEKLRYSDVFPRGLVNDSGTGPADAAETEKKAGKPETVTIASIYDDLDEEDEPRRHTFAKIIIGILLILILAEGVIMGAKFLAPESRISLWANDMLAKAVDMITGNGDETPAPDQEDVFAGTEEDVYMDNLVATETVDIKTIGEAVYSADVTFDKLNSYGFEEIPQADKFVDADWFTDSEGNNITYGQKLIEALIRYYDSWQTVNNDESLVGINSLEIGEIRTGAEGFYVLCRITYAGADGSEVVKYQTVYLRISDETMIINEIKEDNL